MEMQAIASNIYIYASLYLFDFITAISAKPSSRTNSAHMRIPASVLSIHYDYIVFFGLSQFWTK